MTDFGEMAAQSTDLERQLNYRIGRKVLLALLSQPLWVTRTVEAVSFVDRHTTRRRLSRHYVIPSPGHLPSLPGTGLVRLPVFAIPKGQFISCDLVDEHKRAVSLPPLSERAHLSAVALQELSNDLLGRSDERVSELIRDFVTAGPSSCGSALDIAMADSAMKQQLFSVPHFDYLAKYLAYNYVVFIDVPNGAPAAPPRRVIRFELDTRFPHKNRELRQFRELRNDANGQLGLPSPDWKTDPIGVNKWLPRFARVALRRFGLMSNPYHHFVPVDGAGSWHLDVEGTEGLAFARRQLRFRRDEKVVYNKTKPGASSRRARFLVPRTKGRGEAAMTINIRPAPGLLRTGAPLLLLAFAALLYAIAIRFDGIVEKSAAVSLLLLLPGLVAVVTARPNEHPYVTSVVSGTRFLAIMPLPLGVLAAYVLLTKDSPDILRIEAAVAAAFGLILLLGRVIDEIRVRPDLTEFVENDLTRIG